MNYFQRKGRSQDDLEELVLGNINSGYIFFKGKCFGETLYKID